MLVLGREFLITGLRSAAATEGFAIQARDLGKLKMVLQIVAVVAAILAHRWYEWNFFGFIIGVELIARISIWFMLVVLTSFGRGLLHRLLGSRGPFGTQPSRANCPGQAGSRNSLRLIRLSATSLPAPSARPS